jgi:hypothetical protein
VSPTLAEMAIEEIFMIRAGLLLAGIAMSAGFFACSIEDVETTSSTDPGQGLTELGADGGMTLPDSGPMPPPPPPPPPPWCDGESTSVAPKPGVTAFLCVISPAAADASVGALVVTASFQIEGAYFGSSGTIAGSLSLDAVLTMDDLGNSAITIIDETSGVWVRDGIPMSAAEFAALWSAVAPGQLAPSPGGSMPINVTVPIEGGEDPLMALAVAAPDPCQADANNLDAAATNYNLVVGGSLLGAAAIGVLEVPTLGAATAGFVGLGGAVIGAKVNYNAACKNFQLCCTNNNWPAGVCSPKGAKRRGCKNDG